MATTNFSPSIYGSVFRLNASGETFSTLRSSAGTATDSASAAEEMPRIVAYTSSDQWTQLRRAIYQFDTSSIPDTDNISSATLYVYVNSVIQTLSGQSTVVTACTPASTSSLANADYNIANWSDTKLSNEIAIGDLSTSAYNGYVLNASGLSAISKTGYTKLGIRLSCDVDNSAPTWGSGQDAASIIELASGGDNDAYLAVTYNPPTGGSPMFFSKGLTLG